jgi:long-chain-fatty-acid--CoA ligase ACSBG
VPRVWEKIREGLLSAGEKKYQGWTGSILKGVSTSAKAVNYSYQKSVNDSESSWSSYLTSCINYPAYCVSSTLTDQIKLALGLDRCKYFASGAAPISTEVLEYFMSLNMPILEIYGMSETAGIITISDPFSALDKYCGCPASGVEIKIDRDTDEILVRGDNVFSGYHNYDGDMSDMFDDDGFFRTGDCGVLEGGKLRITGRLKELIITAGGENIPPVLIENHIKREVQTDSQMMVIGDQKKYLTILVFNPESEPQLTEADILRAITEYNTNHAISRSQKIQKFALIKEELTVESGLLTPTMKMKRKKIEEHYAKAIEDMYNA